MLRWIGLVAGLGIAATALWLLVSGGEPPHSEIDPASRAQLEELLERAPAP